MATFLEQLLGLGGNNVNAPIVQTPTVDTNNISGILSGFQSPSIPGAAGQLPQGEGFNFGNLAAGAEGLSGLLSAFGGIKGLNLAKKQFKHNQNLDVGNFNNQVALTNDRLATRHETRGINARNNGSDRFQGNALQLSQFGQKP